jgi:hypothetical protein
MSTSPMLYAIVAEFSHPDKLLHAARQCRERYEAVDAYAPYSVEGLADAVGFRRNRVALLALLGGIAGGVGIYALMWYSAVLDYPINSGGRPLDSWQVFVIPTFELTVLGAALAAFIGMLVLNGLPRLHHPIFNAPDFDLASRNRFFVSVRATDQAFERSAVRTFLQGLDPIRVFEVPA